MSRGDAYWWSSFGDFEPGTGMYPHMGQVIAHYRMKRGFSTQLQLAIALGCSKRTVEELEGSMNLNNPDSVERRMLIAQLLRIPPALLALDWRFMASEDNKTQQDDMFSDIFRIQSEDLFHLYEDVLVMGWGYLYNGGQPYTADRVNERLHTLRSLVEGVSGPDKEQWLSLLCRYYQLTTRFAQRGLAPKRALHDAKHAVDIALEVQDVELIASSLFRRVRVYMEHSSTASDEKQKQKCLVLAKEDIDAALLYVEKVRTPLKGNIQLIAAEVNSLFAGTDVSLRSQCTKWQDKAANLVYKGNLENE